MAKSIILLIGLIIIALGVVCIYDARELTQKLFSFGDQNEGTSGLKILGVLFCIIGILMVIFNV